MSKPDETGTARLGFRDGPDLRKEYRPIGIGAVAAALSVTAKDADQVPQTSRENDERNDADNDRFGYNESIAA